MVKTNVPNLKGHIRLRNGQEWVNDEDKWTKEGAEEKEKKRPSVDAKAKAKGRGDPLPGPESPFLKQPPRQRARDWGGGVHAFKPHQFAVQEKVHQNHQSVNVTSNISLFTECVCTRTVQHGKQLLDFGYTFIMISSNLNVHHFILVYYLTFLKMS